MSIPYHVVVSSENSLYMAWQTRLFCFSAWNTLRQRPTVIVHTSGPADESLRPEFRALRERGFPVLEAPSYAMTPTGVLYPPRNELGTMLELASMHDHGASHILFCEPDMLFVHPLKYSGSLAAEFYVYLDYEEQRVANAARHFNLEHLISFLNSDRRIGVPYLIPVQLIGRLASRWIAVLDAFEELQWVDIMYAFGIAAAIEHFDVEVTHLMCDNYRSTRPLRGLIHYCHGDSVWSKRSFRQCSPLELPDEALSLGMPGTVLGEIMRQMRQAKRFFSSEAQDARPDISAAALSGF